MKELIFRAWDEEAEEMRYTNKEYDDFFFDFNKEENGLSTFRLVKIPSTTINPPDTDIEKVDCEIMQYTGKEDKNGTKIFDGDILKSDRGYSGVVDLESLIYASWEWTISDNIEVIGNKFENP
jgi:uncharacterized phage protein (TIGR01671 family)